MIDGCFYEAGGYGRSYGGGDGSGYGDGYGDGSGYGGYGYGYGGYGCGLAWDIHHNDLDTVSIGCQTLTIEQWLGPMGVELAEEYSLDQTTIEHIRVLLKSWKGSKK